MATPQPYRSYRSDITCQKSNSLQVTSMITKFSQDKVRNTRRGRPERTRAARLHFLHIRQSSPMHAAALACVACAKKLKGLPNEDFAVLGQFCAKGITHCL